MKCNYILIYTMFWGIGKFKTIHKYFEHYEDVIKYCHTHNLNDYGIYKLFEYVSY